MNNSNNHIAAKRWKVSFFILLLVNGIIVSALLAFLYLPVADKTIDINTNDYSRANSSEFVVRTTKQNVNDLANAYLEKLLEDSRQKYTLIIEDDVQLIGELPIFSATVPLHIHFDPTVLPNGDLILKQKSISIGILSLPNKQVLTQVERFLPVPEWVTINPNEEEIYVSITNMDIKSNFQVRAEQFDLEANVIAFKINIPYSTLGIDAITGNE